MTDEGTIEWSVVFIHLFTILPSSFYSRIASKHILYMQFQFVVSQHVLQQCAGTESFPTLALHIECL
jgi:hypothetical protein